jgi:hypothetical protein
MRWVGAGFVIRFLGRVGLIGDVIELWGGVGFAPLAGLTAALLHITATLPRLQTTSIHNLKSINGNLDWEN